MDVPFLARQERLRQLLEEHNLAAMALNPGSTLTYLTGLHFHLSERPAVLLLPVEGDLVLVLPELELRKTENLTFTARPFPYGEDPSRWQEAFHKAVLAADLDRKAIGIEPGRLRLLEYGYLQQAAPEASFHPATGVLENLRSQKDPEEVLAMQKAVDIAQQALLSTLPSIKAGRTEKEIAAELVLQLLRAGSESELPFSPIVSAGPNGANPHASPSSRPVRNGDLLVIDWGATSDGYVSDITRTFAIGDVDPEYQEIHAIVQAANAAARAAVRPGITTGEVDTAAREVIEAAGYGEFFTHRTGHGLGLEGHEPPYIRAGSEVVLQQGMTFTIEPGIYLSGRNGVRIEDNVVVTDVGGRTLTSLPRELLTPQQAAGHQEG